MKRSTITIGVTPVATTAESSATAARRRPTVAFARYAIFACLVVAFSATAATAAAASESASPAKSEVQVALDRIIASGMPGAVVLARDGDRTTILAGGYGNVKQKTAVKPTDRFRVGSVTKTFVATVVLQLVAEGKLALDDTVEQRLPGAIPNGKGITVRQLLNMTSGLFDYLNDGDSTVDDRLLKGGLTYRWTPQPADRDLECPQAAVRAGHLVGVLQHLLRPARDDRREGDRPSDRRRAPQPDLRPARPPVDDLRRRPGDLRRARARLRGREQAAAGRERAQPVARLGRRWPRVECPATSHASTARCSAGSCSARDLLRAMETIAPVKAGTGFGPYGLGLFKSSVGCGAVYGHPGAIVGYEAYAYNSKDGKHQAVVLVSMGAYSQSDAAGEAINGALAAAYCTK